MYPLINMSNFVVLLVIMFQKWYEHNCLKLLTKQSLPFLKAGYIIGNYVLTYMVTKIWHISSWFALTLFLKQKMWEPHTVCSSPPPKRKISWLWFYHNLVQLLYSLLPFVVYYQPHFTFELKYVCMLDMSIEQINVKALK